MRKPTRAELEESLAFVKESEHALGVVVRAQVAGDLPDAEETFKDRDGHWYTLRLYGVLNADGGSLLEVFEEKGKRPHVTAGRFEPWLEWARKSGFVNEESGDRRDAADRLDSTRRGIYREERERRERAAS